ncbi:alpha/beta-hydrolase [Aspergillus pseudoustus]|uniref:Alpha/beta-hydrolase n=1 Tax=Aspergillus pseudoustus TaxID=1810923 RepID=A0ABR4J6W6_9EURO
MSDLPTLVFIPGSWHKPTCYDKIITLLQDQYKLRCVAISLPSTGDNPAATFKDDLDAARTAISNEVFQGHDVVVIAHSYGGMVGNSAIKGFARADITDKNISGAPASNQGHIIGLILIASGFTLTGLSFMDPFFGRPPPAWRVNKETGYAELVTPPRELFYHDVPDEEAEYWISQLTTQSLKALFEGGEHTYAGWRDVPVWYIGTVEDRGLPVLAQRMQVGMARGMGANVEHRELRTSHSPFLSQPGETVRVIGDAVGAFLGRELADLRSDWASASASPDPGQGAVIAVPSVRLWQPFSWLNLGLPLTFGHLVGRGILLFGLGRRIWRMRFGLRSR